MLVENDVQSRELRTPVQFLEDFVSKRACESEGQLGQELIAGADSIDEVSYVLQAGFGWKHEVVVAVEDWNRFVMDLSADEKECEDRRRGIEDTFFTEGTFAGEVEVAESVSVTEVLVHRTIPLVLVDEAELVAIVVGFHGADGHFQHEMILVYHITHFCRQLSEGERSQLEREFACIALFAHH